MLRHGRWQVRTLNGFELVGPDGPLRQLQPAAARLIALLALQHVPAQRVRVASTLWMDTTDKRAHANLRSLLWRVQQQYDDLIEVTPTRVSLGDGVEVDLWRSRARARAVLEHRLTPEPLDIELFAAELLPDWYDEWVIVERERERQRWLHALELLCTWFTLHGEPALGLDAGLAAIAAEPLRESAHRVVISAHLAEGNTAEAVRQYHRYARLLATEMGLRPSARMVGLLDSLISPARSATAGAARDTGVTARV